MLMLHIGKQHLLRQAGLVLCVMRFAGRPKASDLKTIWFRTDFRLTEVPLLSVYMYPEQIQQFHCYPCTLSGFNRTTHLSGSDTITNQLYACQVEDLLLCMQHQYLHGVRHARVARHARNLYSIQESHMTRYTRD